jgi:hypothetical protein
MQIDWQLNLGHILTALSAIVAVVAAMGRLSQKVDTLSGEVQGLAEEVREHVRDDARRFDEVTRVLYRLSGRLGNGENR